jgi:hypothetical protein
LNAIKIAAVAGLAVAPFALAACGDDDGGNGSGNNSVNNNNGNTNDNDGGIPDGGDGSIPPVCEEDPDNMANRTAIGIYDNEAQLTPDGSSCNVVDLRTFDDKYYMVCEDNRLIAYDPILQNKKVYQFGAIPFDSTGPDGELGDVYPQALTVLETEDNVPIAITTAQTENIDDDVKGIMYINGVGGEDFHVPSGGRMDSWDLVVQVTMGGDPNFFYVAQDPLGSVYVPSSANDGARIWVAPQQFNRDSGQYVISDVLGFQVSNNNGTIQVVRNAEPKLAPSSVTGYRPSGMIKLDDTTIAVAFAGVASTNPNEAESAKLSFIDPTESGPFVDDLRTIDLQLGDNWELIPLPRITVTNDKRNFIMAAKNASTGKQEIVIQHINDPSNIETTSYGSVQRLDISSYTTGPITNILVDDGNRVYVTEKGDGTTPGKLIVFDINLDTGEPGAIVDTRDLGINAGKAVFNRFTGMIYQYVEKRMNCEAVHGSNEAKNSPYLIKIDTSQI